MPPWAATAFSFAARGRISPPGLDRATLRPQEFRDLGPELGDGGEQAPWPLSAYYPGQEQQSNSTFRCQPHNYTTQLVSLDPLVIYIHDFLHPREMDDMLAASEHLLAPSTVTRYGVTVRNEYRTSWSAEVPRDNAAVRCVEKRVWAFMGTAMARGKDAVEPPQMVRYTAARSSTCTATGTRSRCTSGAAAAAPGTASPASSPCWQDNCTGGEDALPAGDTADEDPRRVGGRPDGPRRVDGARGRRPGLPPHPGQRPVLGQLAPERRGRPPSRTRRPACQGGVQDGHQYLAETVRRAGCVGAIHQKHRAESLVPRKLAGCSIRLYMYY